MGETATTITAAGAVAVAILGGIFAGFAKMLHEIKKMQNGAADQRTANAVKEVCDVIRDEMKEHRYESVDAMKPIVEGMANVTHLQNEMLFIVRGKPRENAP